uniref:ApaG domain-containing protein n=2 Tax=Triticinae TaxID=1648030 RepID=A0A452Y463_AEGTS
MPVFFSLMFEESIAMKGSLKADILTSMRPYSISSVPLMDAAKYRDELMILAPHSLLKCSSDATTLGIRVQVRSVYIESRSQPLKGKFFFAYRIRITNNSQRAVQLLRRHWIVTDANGRTENVWGVGVVGEQPVIFPKTGFEYSSACPLNTPNGRMEGDFEMKHIDKVGSSTFNIAIAPFSLSILGDDNDAPL